MSPEEIQKLYAQMASNYEKRVSQEKDYVAFERVPKWIVKTLHSMEKPIKVLDLGCGTGLSSVEFFKSGYHVTGIDITQEMINEAKKLPFERLLCHSIEGLLPFDDKEFDVTVLLGVMEFVMHPKVLFREVKRILKSKGLFGLTVPVKLPQDVEKKLHIFSYAKRDIETIFNICGFSIIFEEEIPGFISEGETVKYYAYILQPF
ncbi:MAG: class I SAM-dependent methyltransferase [Chlamydiota bacterium]